MPAALDDRRTTLVIWGAMLTGCLLFAGVATYVRSLGGMAGGRPPEVLGWLALALPVVLVAASFSIPSLFRPQGVPEGVARARLIVGWALREGGALLGAVVWLISGDAKALAGFAIAVTALAATPPTDGRWRAAVEAAGGKPERSPMVR